MPFKSEFLSLHVGHGIIIILQNRCLSKHKHIKTGISNGDKTIKTDRARQMRHKLANATMASAYTTGTSIPSMKLSTLTNLFFIFNLLSNWPI